MTILRHDDSWGIAVLTDVLIVAFVKVLNCILCFFYCYSYKCFIAVLLHLVTFITIVI